MSAALLCLLLGAAGGRLVVALDGGDLRRGAADVRIEELARALDAEVVRRLPFAVVLDTDDVAAAERAISARRDVRWHERERKLHLRLRSVDDPLYPNEWHLHPTAATSAEVAIDVEGAWLVSRGTRLDGTPVRVAVIDDGFALAHEDLAARLLPGRDLVADIPDDDPSAGPGDVHGTQTAGVIAATGDNGVGVAGVCPACALVPVRLVGGGGPRGLYEVDSSVAAEAIIWSYETAGADVINNSWGPPDGSPLDPAAPRTLYTPPRALDEALRLAARDGRGGLGAVVTWAAGNGGELATYDRYASHPSVVAVGAISAAGRRAYYSDFGPTVLLVAPSSGGVQDPAITTCDLPGPAGAASGDYSETYGGTSAASAIVAGVAALVIAGYPELTAAQVVEAMLDSAYRIDEARGAYDAAGRSREYGFGRVDAALALALAATYAGPCTRAFELCGNNRDDNCDGTADEAARCEPCLPDAGNELCDGHDNDCDGEVDEDFACERTGRPVCAPCTSSAQCTDDARCREADGVMGRFCFTGCREDAPCGTGFTCDGEVCAIDVAGGADCRDLLACHYPERCDGVDSDCNGVIDDVAMGGPEEVAARERLCQNEGVCVTAKAACLAGAWSCPPPADFEAVELSCDGLDNDCDGVIDEDSVCDEGCSCSDDGGGAPAWVAALLVGALAALRRRSLAPRFSP